MAGYETIEVSKADGVAWVTLNRPEVRNAVNEQMQRELHEVWTAFRYDDEVRCVVLTGAGQSFCTGIDRAEAVSEDNNASMAAGDYPGYPTPWMYDDPGRDLGPKMCDLWKPVIAAVQGIACGGAFYLLGEVDVIIASDDATFFDPHVTYGMAAVFESVHMLQRMPLGEVLRMQLTGAYERVSAQRAYEIGLVSEVVGRDELASAAERLARVIASQPALAVQATLRTIWAAQDVPRRQALDASVALVAAGNTPEALAEGQTFFESGKRVDWRLR